MARIVPTMKPGPEPVHRPDDGELVGHVRLVREDAPMAERWSALAVFGGELERFDHREAAVAYLCRHGLAVLADKWWYRPGAGQPERLVYLIEAAPGRVTLRFGLDPASNEIAVLTGPALDQLHRHCS